MKSPEHFIQSLIGKLPKPVRAVASAIATCFLWVLFLESAVSLVSGKPFVRIAVLDLVEASGPYIGDLILLAWDIVLSSVELWNSSVKESIRNFALHLGFTVSSEIFDIAAVVVFGMGAWLRARREKFAFERAVLRAAKAARKQCTPSLAFDPEAYRQLVRRRRLEEVSAELYDVQRNLDQILLTIVDNTRNLAPYNRYANAIVNMGIAETNALKVSERTAVENWDVLMNGGRLRDTYRDKLLSEMDRLMPWIFTEREGWNLLVKTVFAMRGTKSESKAKWWGRQKVRFIYLIAVLVLVITVVDLVLS